MAQWMKVYEQQNWGMVENSLSALPQRGRRKLCEEALLSSVGTHVHMPWMSYLSGLLPIQRLILPHPHRPCANT